MALSHIFHLGATPPQKVRAGGTRVDAKKELFPVLSGISISILSLKPKGVREPHWHPNAHELSYCLQGSALMTIFGPNNMHETFTLAAGDIAFVPMGSMHHIENIGEDDLKMAIVFSHESPEDLEISSAVGVMSNYALGATFNKSANYFDQFTKTIDPVFISQEKKATPVEPSMAANRFKLRLEHAFPQVQTKGGWVKMAHAGFLPTLDNLAIYSLCLEKEGVREPHWHPNAHELNYCISGSARITLLSPGGKVDKFEMKAGDISFLPRGYFHDIENIGSDPCRFAIFFNHKAPSDIGLTGCMGAYPNEILSSVFNVNINAMKDFPKYQEDLFIVAGGG